MLHNFPVSYVYRVVLTIKFNIPITTLESLKTYIDFVLTEAELTFTKYRQSLEADDSRLSLKATETVPTYLPILSALPPV